jgi:hypothetical protein
MAGALIWLPAALQTGMIIWIHVLQARRKRVPGLAYERVPMSYWIFAWYVLAMLIGVPAGSRPDDTTAILLFGLGFFLLSFWMIWSAACMYMRATDDGIVIKCQYRRAKLTPYTDIKYYCCDDKGGIAITTKTSGVEYTQFIDDRVPIYVENCIKISAALDVHGVTRLDPDSWADLSDQYEITYMLSDEGVAGQRRYNVKMFILVTVIFAVFTVFFYFEMHNSWPEISYLHLRRSELVSVQGELSYVQMDHSDVFLYLDGSDDRYYFVQGMVSGQVYNTLLHLRGQEITVLFRQSDRLIGEILHDGKKLVPLRSTNSALSNGNGGRLFYLIILVYVPLFFTIFSAFWAVYTYIGGDDANIRARNVKKLQSWGVPVSAEYLPPRKKKKRRKSGA